MGHHDTQRPAATNGVGSIARPRPRVICHMITSLDGRIVVNGWPLSAEGRRQYDEIHETYQADGWICGRITMEPFAGQVRPDADLDRPGGGLRADYRAPGDYRSFAFAVDPSGKLAWESNDIAGDHVVAILAERVGDEYLAFLRDRNVSYLLAGAGDVDLTLAMEKIVRLFPVRTLMLEGGGRLNGSMLRAGLIDEVSLLLAPVADPRSGMPALFDATGDDVAAQRLTLEGVERRVDDVLWLRYRVDAATVHD